MRSKQGDRDTQGEGEATVWLKAMAWLEETHKAWGGAGMAAGEGGGLVRHALALALAVGVRQGSSCFSAWAIQRVKWLRSLVSCSQGPWQAARAGPAQTARKWMEPFSKNCTFLALKGVSGPGFWVGISSDLSCLCSWRDSRGGAQGGGGFSPGK